MRQREGSLFGDHRPRHRFEITETTLRSASFDPAHDGLRLAQISDIHIGPGTPEGRVASAIREINARRPELVFLTGDYLTHSRGPLRHLERLLGGILAPTFAVLGNHDHYVDARAVRQGLERCGYAVLQNAHTTLQLRGAPLTLLGVDDGYSRKDDVTKTFRGAPEHGTRLVLTHSPPTAEKLPGAGLVCFSGHTHGGQILIPRLTAALFERVGQPYIRGLYQVRQNQLYVNRGLGFGLGSTLPRIGSEPEVAFFTLQAARPALA
jgi:uncharacterized protein